MLLRWLLYSAFSALLTYGVMNHAYVTREQFYPAVIYLVTNKFSVVVLGNMAMVIVVSIAAFLKMIFLGDLKTAEVEVSRSILTWLARRVGQASILL